LRPYWLAPPQHLFYYSPKTLQLLVRRCGFKILDMRGTYPIDRHLLLGENYIQEPSLGKRIHQRRVQDELFSRQSSRLWDAREQQYRYNLAEHRLGREILVFARKEA
jgi:hypothetical protein